MSPPFARRETLRSVAAKHPGSITRTSRPPLLKLETSNRATEWDSPLLQRTAPLQTNVVSPNGSRPELPLYSPLSEGPATTSTASLPNMGIGLSKETTQSDDQHQSGKKKYRIFKRASKSPAPRPPSFTFPPSKPASEPQEESKDAQSLKEQPILDSQESSNPNSAGQESQSQKTSIQSSPSTSSFDVVEKRGEGEHDTGTPVLRLPTPSLMPEESPGQYGMSDESTTLRSEHAMTRPRPKSGTGAQIFKVRFPYSSSPRSSSTSFCTAQRH